MREIYPKQKENVRDEKQRKYKIREIHQVVQHSLNSSRKKDEGKLERNCINEIHEENFKNKMITQEKRESELA